MVELKANGKYFTAERTRVFVVHAIPISNLRYAEGYRFRDQHEQYYFPDGRIYSHRDSLIDLVEEMTDTVVSDIPFDQISVDDRVISVMGNHGVIVNKENKGIMGNDPDEQYVTIRWDHTPQLSRQPSKWLDAVRYLGKETICANS